MSIFPRCGRDIFRVVADIPIINFVRSICSVMVVDRGGENIAAWFTRVLGVHEKVEFRLFGAISKERVACAN